MALKQTFNFRGINVANGYLKIGYVSGSKEKVTANLEKYTQDKANIIDVYSFEFVPNMDGENFIKQSYKHLKTLPEFANAIDC